MIEVAKKEKVITLGLLRFSTHILGVDITRLIEVAPINQLDPIIDERALALGLVSIRGSLIPVIDPAILLGGLTKSSTPRVAAVVSDGCSVFCLGIDGISGLRRCAVESIQNINGFEVVPIEGYGNVHLVDIAQVISCGAVPCAKIRQKNTKRVSTEVVEPYLTFSAGGVDFAINAKSIFCTLPRRDMDDRSFGEGALLGLINHLDRKIPVIDAPLFFNVGARLEEGEKEIVVLKLSGSNLVGLAVDKIMRIEHPRQSDIVPIDPLALADLPYFEGHYESFGRIYFVVDLLILFGDNSFNAFAALSSVGGNNEGMQKGQRSLGVSGNIDRESHRQLIFSAGRVFSTPIYSISKIVEVPSCVFASHKGSAGLLGYFFVGDLLTPLFCLEKILLGVSSRIGFRSRILLVESASKRVGFLVESVDDIAVSRWFSFEGCSSKCFGMVEVSRYGRKQLLSWVNLGLLLENES